jgi:hypothetical protein
MSKRRKGFPSEKKVKRGVRIVHGNKELSEKLGWNDLCPCGSGRRFKRCCMKTGCFRWRESGSLLLENEKRPVRLARPGRVLLQNREPNISFPPSPALMGHFDLSDLSHPKAESAARLHDLFTRIAISSALRLRLRPSISWLPQN